MQNAGQQFGQGGTPSHQSVPFGHSENTTTGGSITSSLRQFRKKNDDNKHHLTDGPAPVAESHVARVAPHNHYPPASRPSTNTECYRFPTTQQYQDFNAHAQVKYSEIAEGQLMQDHESPSVIQKVKGKDYMEMCNVAQPHPKQPYEVLHAQQGYHETNVHPHAQYIPKEPQVNSPYKPESQYFPKETPAQQYPPHHVTPPHHMHLNQQPPQQQSPHQKYGMPAGHQLPKYQQQGNDFLSKLRRINPNMARSIMSDHHLQETQMAYQSMEHRGMYGHQNQRYVNYSGMQNTPYPHHMYVSPTHPNATYSNYPPSCNYARSPQMAPARYPPERDASPRRPYQDGVGSMPLNYGAMPAQKMSPGYHQYGAPEYAQHYQHRRGAPVAAQEYYQHCRPTQYLPHQMSVQELPEARVTVSDNIKQYIENWADEDTASEINQLDSNRLCKDGGGRLRDDQSNETVYMINASDIQYLENGIPVVNSETGIPMVSENAQYIIKGLDSSSGVVRIIGKNGQMEIGEIVDHIKPDCMLATKSNDLDQRHHSGDPYGVPEKPRVVVHQNTVIQSSFHTQNAPGEMSYEDTTENEVKVGNSLPMIAETLDELSRKLSKESKKETVDKNCSPINIEQMESYNHASVICPNKALEEELAKIQESSNSEDSMRSMPFIDSFSENNETVTNPENIQESTATDAKLEETTEVPEGADNLTRNEQPTDNIHTLTADIVNNTETKDQASGCEKPELNATKKYDNTSDEARETVEQQKVDENDVCSIEELKNFEKQQTGCETEKSDTPTTVENQISPVDKNTAKRSKRIFSVDDIMNTIGNNINKHDEITERRHSLQTAEEIPDAESFIQNLKSSTTMAESKEQDTVERKPDEETITVDKEAVKTTEVEENFLLCGSLDEKMEATTPIAENDKSSTISKEEHMETEENVEQQSDKKKSTENESCSPPEELKDNSLEVSVPEEANINLTLQKLCNDNATSDIVSSQPSKQTVLELLSHLSESTEHPKASEDHEKLLKEQDDHPKEPVEPIGQPMEKPKTPSLKETSEDSQDQSEIQYQHVIRVEESSVLLHIAGELVEITVNTVNGKKVITVVPMSDTSVVDLNDNYETLETLERLDTSRTNEFLTESDNISEVANFQVVAPEAEIVETTSEIIIGMDLSLEEEIKLDVDEPPIICTKAARKAYDTDLQIPSITTSEDVNDSTRSPARCVNDKVSSTKEKVTKDWVERRKITKEGSTEKSGHSKRLATRGNEKSAFKNLNDAHKQEKVKPEQKDTDEEFVPFKELVKARKLKKLKMLELKKSQDGKIDSTMRIDEIKKLENNETDAESKVRLFKNVSMDHPKCELPTVELERIDYSIAHNEPGNTQPEAKTLSSNQKDKSNQEKPAKPKEVAVEGPEVVSKKEIRDYRLEDPRLKDKADVVKLKYPEPKKKLSLEEYNRRKRKVTMKDEEVVCKKIALDNPGENAPVSCPVAVNKKQAIPKRIRFPRPKSLDDMNSIRPKPNKNLSRKLSLGSSPVYDWEETQSPKTNSTQNNHDQRFSEFRGLINDNKSVQPELDRLREDTVDDTLQNYKEQVQFKLSSLNIQIPMAPKSTLEPESKTLMQKFLKNKKLTAEEIDKIRKIISYKRLVQQINHLKSPEAGPKTSYEIQKEHGENQTKLHLRKVNEKKRKYRFRLATSDSEEEGDFRSLRNGDYSVVQANCLAGVVPKLIIKRKTEMPLPVVRLERLDLDTISDKTGYVV